MKQTPPNLKTTYGQRCRKRFERRADRRGHSRIGEPEHRAAGNPAPMRLVLRSAGQEAVQPATEIDVAHDFRESESLRGEVTQLEFNTLNRQTPATFGHSVSSAPPNAVANPPQNGESSGCPVGVFSPCRVAG